MHHYTRVRQYGATHLPTRTAQRLPLTERDAAWLAGVIDCEGWIGLMRNGGPARKCAAGFSARIGVGNTNAKLIDRLVQITGMGRVTVSMRPPPAKPVYQWNVSRADDADRLLVTIREHLILKQEQADVLLSLPPRHAKANAERAEAYAKCAALNRKGVAA